MTHLGAIAASRWVLSLIGVALIAGLVWVFGPLLAPLEVAAVRLGIVVALLAIWAAANLSLDLWRRRREAVLARGITSGAEEEAAALREKLAESLALLKKSLGRRGYLYEQPWYAIIGPPGAGKTTALLNSGLRFPLAERMGQGAIAGVGGTRLCDWWFTEQAVLIDTAGRYTTQDSNVAVDRAGWETFLGLLKKTRPRQPLNGLIVAFPLSDIAAAPPAERAAHAAAIRGRIEEMQTRLGARMPVYVLLTKADLIAGFSEFFDDLDAQARAQVWGATFEPASGAADAVAAFGGEFQTLVERLNARLFERLEAERTAERRARIAMFPGQIASLRGPLVEFLGAAFAGQPAQPALWLRGVYITSGTQEGTPIDRLIGAMARAFAVQPARAPSLRPQHGRSYFLERLLKDVIFGEAMLVAFRPAAARGRFALRAAGFALAALIVVASAALFWHVRGAGQREIATAQAALAGYEQSAQKLALDPVADDDMPQLAPLLDRAGDLPRLVRADAPDGKSWLMLGQSQDAKLVAAADAVYRHALDWALLPRLIWRLEAQMRGNLDRPDFLYEATRIYLMLGNAGPLDPSLVHEWMRLDWQLAYPGVQYAGLRASLLRHLDALLAQPLPQVQLDGALVAAARSRFASVSMAQRVYSRIRPSAAARRLPPWRPADALGAAGTALFVRASGKPLTDGIPGFLTVDGFHNVLLPLLPEAAKSVVSESWVLGKRVAFDPSGPEMRKLQHDVIALYEADYVPAWDMLLADLNVVPMRSLPQAAQGLYILASPQSPMRSLLVSISRQLSLSTPPGQSPGAPAPVLARAGPSIETPEMRLESVLGRPAAAAPAAPAPPGHEIDERYEALRDLVGHGPGAPIDLVLHSLTDLQQQLAKMAATLLNGAPAPAPSGIDPTLAIKAEAAREPEPLSRWLNEIAASGGALRSGDARKQLAVIYNAQGGPAEVCPQVVGGHYPFVPNTTEDASLAEFARVFAPGGLIDGFVNTLLRPYIDMSGKTWRAQSAGSVAAPVTAADLAQFQRAAQIRDAFFAKAAGAPTIRFDVTPLGADAVTRRVMLKLGGTTIAYAHDAPRSTQVTWPAPAGQQGARLTFDPPAAGNASGLQETGPWATFRLFRRGRLAPQPGAPGLYRLTFQIGKRSAAFTIRVQSPVNPFAPSLLQDFRCPAVSAN